MPLILQPDLAAQRWASAQTYRARADFRNTKLTALVCSIYPYSSLHCTQIKLVCCSPALLGGFGISPVASTPRSTWKHHCAVLRSCIFLGEVIKRVLHNMSTCKLSQEAESSYKKSLTSLIQEGWYVLWGGDYGAWDCNFFFPNPQSNQLQQRTIFERLHFLNSPRKVASEYQHVPTLVLLYHFHLPAFL